MENEVVKSQVGGKAGEMQEVGWGGQVPATGGTVVGAGRSRRG